MKRIALTIAAGLAGITTLGGLNAAAQETAATADGDPAKAWTADYAAARQKAIDEKKDLLLVFTGSDWIKLCELYDRDILFQTDFTGPVSESFVPVRMDFPKEIKLPAEQKARNQLLMRAYRVAAFPTLVLTDTAGRPYGINGYQPVTPADYAKVVEAMKQTRVVRDDLFTKAAEAEGVEKASLLAQAIPKLPGSLAARYYRAELEEIMALDPDNETGKVPVCKKLIADADYSDEMQKLKGDIEWSKMIELTDTYIADQKLQGAALQQALFNKVGVYRDQANIEAMAGTLLEIVKIDETSDNGKRAQKVLDGMRAKVLEGQLAPK